MNKKALIIGASSGMGAAMVRQLASEGWTVGAIARSGESLESLAKECGPERVFTHAHDVQETAAIPALFEALVKELGGLDLVVYAAGVMPAVELDEFNTEKDLLMMNVNIGGCIAWLNPIAEFFKSQRSGTIIGISSIAGDRGRKPAPVYCTSKAAMNTYLESLRNRLAEFGVHVCTIRPGFIDTQMTKGMDKLMWLISAEEAAKRILKIGLAGKNVRYVPFRWMWVGLIIRHIPSFIFRRLSI
jgi:short-subunit dehydrogenase